MAKLIKIVVVEPNKQPYVLEIENVLKEIQRVVEGHIDIVRIAEDIDMYINDEGLFTKPFNRYVGQHDIHGTFFLASLDERGDTVSLSEEDIEMCLTVFRAERILII